MQTLKLTPVAVLVMKMFGPPPFDFLREAQYEENLVLSVELSVFHQVAKTVCITQGLELSQYYVLAPSGYEGAFLN